MLAYNFDYYLPDTLKEATDIYDSVEKDGKTPLYFGGGTEIISMARVNNIKPDVVIDIKKIPECCGFGTDGKQLIFGAAMTLSAIQESGLYPLLGLAGGRIADHTIQCKLTLGGNLAGTIYYHEMLLPLLLSDSMIYITSPQGSRKVPITEVLSIGKGLAPGELIVKVALDIEYATLPYVHIKKTKIEKIGYPLVSLSAIYKDGYLRLAASGLCTYPFRFSDTHLNSNISAAELAEQLVQSIPGTIIDDLEGSAKYREFIFKKTVENIIIKLRKS